MNSLFDNSLICVLDQVLDEIEEEYLFVLLGGGSLFFFIAALCLSPILLNLYKNRVTTLMSTQAGNEGFDTNLDRIDSLAIGNNTQLFVEYGQGSKESLWASAQTRIKRFDIHILQTVLLHLGLLMIVVIVGNVHELTDSLLENLGGVVGICVFIGLLSTPMLHFVRDNKITLTVTWLVSFFILVIALYIEILSGSYVHSSDTYWIFGVIIFLFWSLHAGLSGRQLRNVVPFLAVALTLASLFMYLIFRLDALGGCILQVDESDIRTLVVVVVSLVAGVILTVRLIRWIAGQYEQKRISNRQVQVGCWLIFTSIVVLILLQVEDEDSVALRPVAFLVPLVSLFSFWFYFRKSAVVKVGTSPQRLLLLRVFSKNKRGETWLSAVERFWRHLGPVYLIAGPDLAKFNIDPYELYQFLSRNTKSLFIRNEQQAHKHLDEVDNQADPDGRYRVNEFFCPVDIWELVAQGLIKQSDVVVLDLRDFQLSRVGTVKEIDFLAQYNAFSRSLILVEDETTIENLIKLITQLTGLQLSRKQFVAAENLSAQETVLRLLDLREQDLGSLYIYSEPSHAEYLTDESLQKTERDNVRQNLVYAHKQTDYGVNYLVLAFGLIGLFFFSIQLLAPLYLLVRKVSIKRILLLVAVTVCSAILYQVHIHYLPVTPESDFTQPQAAWSIVILLMTSGIWIVVWFYLSRMTNRWIKESQEPLRTALQD